MSIFRSILAVIFAFTLQAEDITSPYRGVDGTILGTVVGVSAGANQSFQVDIAIAFGGIGYTAYGLHVSVDSKQMGSDFKAPKAPLVSNTWASGNKKGEASGNSFGVFINVGRGVLVVGGSYVTQKSEDIRVWANGTTEVYLNKEERKFGAYAKVGYVVGHVVAYAGYNTYLGTTVGLGFVF